MKFIAMIGIGFISSSAFSNPPKVPARPATEKARFVYLEFYPNSDKELTIQSIKCDPKTNDLRIQKFQTESKVTGGSVNVLNVYVRSGECKTSPYSSVWLEKVEVPKNGKPTHVYITILSDNVMVL